jgi:hypothetical protein
MAAALGMSRADGLSFVELAEYPEYPAPSTSPDMQVSIGAIIEKREILDYPFGLDMKPVHWSVSPFVVKALIYQRRHDSLLHGGHNPNPCLCIGDRITSINEQVVTHMATCDSLYDLLKGPPGSCVRIGVDRLFCKGDEQCPVGCNLYAWPITTQSVLLDVPRLSWAEVFVGESFGLDSIIFQGWIAKDGVFSGSFNRRWARLSVHKRSGWFVFNPDQADFRFAWGESGPDNFVEKNSVRFNHEDIATNESEHVWTSNDNNRVTPLEHTPLDKPLPALCSDFTFGFLLKIRGRVMRIFCDSRSNRDGWMCAFNLAFPCRESWTNIHQIYTNIDGRINFCFDRSQRHLFDYDYSDAGYLTPLKSFYNKKTKSLFDSRLVERKREEDRHAAAARKKSTQRETCGTSDPSCPWAVPAGSTASAAAEPALPIVLRVNGFFAIRVRRERSVQSQHVGTLLPGVSFAFSHVGDGWAKLSPMHDSDLRRATNRCVVADFQPFNLEECGYCMTHVDGNNIFEQPSDGEKAAILKRFRAFHSGLKSDNGQDPDHVEHVLKPSPQETKPTDNDRRAAVERKKATEREEEMWIRRLVALTLGQPKDLPSEASFIPFEIDDTGLSEDMVGVGHVLKPSPTEKKPELQGDHATSTRAPAFGGDTPANDIEKQLQLLQQQQQLLQQQQQLLQQQLLQQQQQQRLQQQHQQLLHLEQLLKPVQQPHHLQQRSASKREAAALTPGTGLLRSAAGCASEDDGAAAAEQDRRRCSQ